MGTHDNYCIICGIVCNNFFDVYIDELENILKKGKYRIPNKSKSLYNTLGKKEQEINKNK